MGSSNRNRASWAPGPAGWMLLCLLVPTLLYVWAVREPSPRWRAAYYDDASMETAIVVREERDVSHDWSRREPPAGVPNEHFSARWESCMALNRQQNVAFQLISSGGSRLFVDQALVIDNWNLRPSLQTGGIDLVLAAGLRHIRVESRHGDGAGSVTLLASLDGRRPTRISPEQLRSPIVEEESVCPATDR